MERSIENEILFKSVWGVFGGRPNVSQYWDDGRESSIEIVTSSDRPQAFVSSYSTLALSDIPIYLDNDKEVRVELVAACGSIFNTFPKAIAAVAFGIINAQWPCHRGAIFPDVLSKYEFSGKMRHLLVIPPFLWGEGFREGLDLKTKTVEWLMVIPISENERVYSRENGSAALETLLEEGDIDILDVDRDSVI